MEWNNVEKVEISVGTTFKELSLGLRRGCYFFNMSEHASWTNYIDTNTINLHEMTWLRLSVIHNPILKDFFQSIQDSGHYQDKHY